MQRRPSNAARQHRCGDASKKRIGLVALAMVLPTWAGAMIFGPADSEHRLWDCWVFADRGVHHLYYLTSTRSKGSFDSVSLATSRDGVHWEDRGVIMPKSPQAEWLGTGFTWRNAGASGHGRFIMNFSESRPDLGSRGEHVQHIFFAESDDLLNWRRLPDEHRSSADPRYYRVQNPQRWDCITTVLKGDEPGYWGYLTARPLLRRDGHPEGIEARSFGMAESADGLHWKPLPPPLVEWGDEPDSNLNGHPIWEVGGVAKVGGLFYLLVGTANYKGNANSMWVFTSDDPKGPFRPQRGAFRLLGTKWPHSTTYFARFYDSPDGLLVVHHSIPRADQPHVRNEQRHNRVAPLKRALVDESGTLRLGWWEGNEALKGAELRLPAGIAGSNGSMEIRASALQARISLLPGSLDLKQGVVLEGEAVVEPLEGMGAALGFFVARDDYEGNALLLRTNGRTETGLLYHDGRYGYFPMQQKFRVEDSFSPGETATATGIFPAKRHGFRMLLRGSFLEIYLDGLLVQCVSLPHQTTGRVGFLVEGGKATITGLKVWQMGIER